ncbi:sugar phosphate isomerase/epimerase family protein [Mycobacterium aquaticum]|nr:sugar phosphate isomerase/epimerase family protein [Mycobacterium aquaticum]
MNMPPTPVVAGSTLPLPSVSIADEASWSAGLSALARGGFEWVDVVDNWVPFGDLTVEQGGRLAAHVADAGLLMAGLSAIRRSVIDPIDGSANLAYTHRALDVAAAAGAPVLSIGFHRPLTELQRQWTFWSVPGPADDADDPALWACAVDRLRELCSHAADIGLRLSLELYEDTLIGSGEQTVRLIQDVDSPVLGINADLANLYRVPRRLTEGWLETFAACLPYLNYWHVKNFRRAEGYPDGPFLAWPTQLDDGDINYRLLLSMALDAGYDGPICIEQYGGDGLTAQCAGLAYLTGVLDDLVSGSAWTTAGRVVDRGSGAGHTGPTSMTRGR